MLYGHDEGKNIKQLCDGTTDAVCIKMGGTGATTAAGARKNLGLGDTSGAVPIANGGTGATTASEARTNLGINASNLGLSGAETKTLLWTNASPTSEFAAQTISLDLSSYQFVELVSKLTTSNIGQTVDKCEVGSRVFVEKFYNATSTSAHATIMHRQIDFGSDSVIFADAKSKVTDENTSTTKNSLLIPYKIYGIKGV